MDLIINPNKAGTALADKAKVNAVILESSKGSRYYQNMLEKDAALTKKLELLQDKANSLRHLPLTTEQCVITSKIKDLNRDLSATIVHIDMDAFYASVEELDNPDLKDKPFAVGGIGMLSTSNYLARSFGVRSAMPGYIALKLCPHLIIVPTHFKKYSAKCTEIRNVFSEFDPNYLPMSMDEAYLDITGYLALKKVSADEATALIRGVIFERTGLRASAGVAPNKFLAKICTEVNKPNGQFILESNEEKILEFMGNLPVRKVPGIGRVLERMLTSIDIHTCGQVRENLHIMYRLLTPSMFEFLLHTSLGLGATSLSSDREQKSKSTEQTFSDIKTLSQMLDKMYSLSKSLAGDLAGGDFKGRHLSIKAKTNAFKVYTRGKTLPHSIHSADDIFSAAKTLMRAEFASHDGNLSVRLLGLRMSQLTNRSIDEDNVNGILKFVKRGGDVDEKNQSIGAPISKVERYSEFDCPICHETMRDISALQIERHVDQCLAAGNNDEHNSPPVKKKSKIMQSSIDAFVTKDTTTAACPICQADVAMSHIERHASACLENCQAESSSLDP